VVHVSATPFDHSRADLMEQLAFDDAASGLGTGADRYELVVDTERGVVLRSEAQLEGSPFLIIEIQDVGFDEPFPNDTFTLEAPPGQTFKNSSELFGWRDELEDDP
jgi:hypothetical protein